MAITELIFPAIKTDPDSLREIEQDWPIISKRLTHPNPGLLNAYRGFLLTENGKDVRNAHREFLLFEWVKAECFHAFIKSDQFGSFATSIKHLVNGPPMLQLFETNISPRKAASASVVEIIRLSISTPENVEISTQAWERISRFLSGKASITYGPSSNLENDVVAGIIGWHDTETRSQAIQDSEYTEALNILQSLGDVNRITVDIAAMELPPL
ncbi:hypothetical protein BDV32DRAFT_121292 [Aspergillus pseudonomiae]|uniref:Uncharacterized protein n=1 Tax=Aspergillus pseudonomiae TaxID=1506151 RepID=A0A5N7DN87_9EURO|nr:uncharacterized protein BDV37DRAFT_242232 [Aspergillus pseudonomiae]KAB8261707.1 hypothetical protein BDV32DRAFT_121292 [Aspergillus pseudonomiae]KAE8406948.1 hypothetical protein BDV37DRAFT_242232 [Aspergillus pseudonomiae]